MTQHYSPRFLWPRACTTNNGDASYPGSVAVRVASMSNATNGVGGHADVSSANLGTDG